MSKGKEIEDWGSREGLPPDVITVLVENGFHTLNDLRHMTPADVTECFQKTGLLPLAKCLALRNAIGRLSGGAPPPYTPPDQPDRPCPPPGTSPFGQSSSLGDPGYPVPPKDTQPPHGGFYGSHQPSRQPYPPKESPYQSREYSHQSQGVPPFQQPLGFETFQGAEASPYQPRESPYQPRDAAFQQERTQGAGASWGNQPMESSGFRSGGHSGQQDIRLLLLGKTGSGKSTTGNTIFGEYMFEASANFAAVTADCTLKRTYKYGCKVEIMDSPGLFDTDRSHEEVGTIIIQAVAGMHPGPNAILYVVRLGRYTDEEFSAYNRLKALFDEKITRHLIVLFTGGDELERKGDSIERLMSNLPQNLQKVLKDCNFRYVLFNNFARDPRPQVERLLSMVRELSRQNHGPYVCPKYMNIGETLEAEVARRMQEVAKEELKRQKYVQQLQQQTEAANQQLDKARQDMERKEQEQEERMEQLRQEQQQQMQLLKEQLERQRMSDEQRLKEERELRERQEKEQREMMEKMEQQRREDLERFEKMEQERQRLDEERREEEKKLAEERERRHEQEMNKLKDEVVEKKGGFFSFVGKVIDTVIDFLPLSVPLKAANKVGEVAVKVLDKMVGK